MGFPEHKSDLVLGIWEVDMSNDSKKDCLGNPQPSGSATSDVRVKYRDAEADETGKVPGTREHWRGPFCTCGHDALTHLDGATAADCRACDCRQFTAPPAEPLSPAQEVGLDAIRSRMQRREKAPAEGAGTALNDQIEFVTRENVALAAIASAAEALVATWDAEPDIDAQRAAEDALERALADAKSFTSSAPNAGAPCARAPALEVPMSEQQSRAASPGDATPRAEGPEGQENALRAADALAQVVGHLLDEHVDLLVQLSVGERDTELARKLHWIARAMKLCRHKRQAYYAARGDVVYAAVEVPRDA
jgi:hypothetical protein